jgi:ribosomal protein S18 acetylase RimI-like enzyme
MQPNAGNQRTEFRKVVVSEELELLREIDQKIFSRFPADLFSDEEWAEFESHWMIVDGKIIGCSAFLRDTDFNNEPRPGCLHIMTTGILPDFRRRGFGAKLKQWQIEYAKQQGFRMIVTNTRESNHAMIQLNLKLGFVIRGSAPHFYIEPDEPAIVMELQLDAGPLTSLS